MATELGYEIRPGRRHWRLTHTVTGSLAIVPFGRKRSPRSERNVIASLKRGAREVGYIHPVIKAYPDPVYPPTPDSNV
jgi:hypothetical protein